MSSSSANGTRVAGELSLPLYSAFFHIYRDVVPAILDAHQGRKIFFFRRRAVMGNEYHEELSMGTLRATYGGSSAAGFATMLLTKCKPYGSGWSRF